MGRSKTRAVRKVALIKAHLRRRDEWVEIAIGNVSATGLMAKCSDPPAPGSEVEIRRRGMVIQGRVIWATATRFGLESTEPIDVEQLTGSLRAESKATPEAPTRRWPWHWRE